jgi:autotransporter-associated beta strand protein
MKNRHPFFRVAIGLIACNSPSLAQSPILAGGNGSFETNTRGTAAFGGTFGQIWYLNPVAGNASGADISGWTLTAPGGGTANTNTAWLMGDNTYGAPSDGTYQINVESGPDWWLRASLGDLTIGTSYTITFDARQRAGGGGGNFDVFVDTVVPAGGSNLTPSSTSWAPQSFTFVAEAVTHTLSISNQDVTNVGFFVDKFAIAETPPDPWTPADGIWTGDNGDWSVASNWQADTIGQGTDKSATFNGLAAITATVNVNRPIGSLIFSGANHTLAAGTGSLTLDGDTLFAPPTATVASGITATINATLNGTEGLLKNGAGTLVLPGNNTYSGGTTVSVGTLKLDLGLKSSNPPLGSFAVASGATLNLDNTNTVVGNYFPQSFVLSGEGTLTKTNTGSIDFWNGSNLTGFTGTVDVQEGSLRVNNIGAAANMGQATLNIASGATFDVRYNASLSVDKLTGSGILDQSSNFGGGLGSVTIGSNDGSSTFNGVIQNTSGIALPLTKAGSGTLTLAGLNTYSGNTTIAAGTLELADDAQLRFVVTDGNSNQVGGAGTAAFKGDFLIDTSAVTGSTGALWLLVDLASLSDESFDATFTVIGFDDADNNGVWTMTDTKGDWSFDEATGELSLDVGSDYDDWATAAGVSGAENDDDDADGLSNFEEYAFGLDPLSGSSVSPITLPLDKVGGTFSYVRRKVSQTGLTHAIWTSTDLVNWLEDTTASQVASGIPSTPNESVAVTLSAPPTAAKFFVQVRAN